MILVERVTAKDGALDRFTDKGHCVLRVQCDGDVFQTALLSHRNGLCDENLQVFPDVEGLAETRREDDEIFRAGFSFQCSEVLGLELLIFEVALDGSDSLLQRGSGQVMKSAFVIENDYQEVGLDLREPVV